MARGCRLGMKIIDKCRCRKIHVVDIPRNPLQPIFGSAYGSFRLFSFINTIQMCTLVRFLLHDVSRIAWIDQSDGLPKKNICVRYVTKCRIPLDTPNLLSTNHDISLSVVRCRRNKMENAERLENTYMHFDTVKWHDEKTFQLHLLVLFPFVWCDWYNSHGNNDFPPIILSNLTLILVLHHPLEIEFSGSVHLVHSRQCCYYYFNRPNVYVSALFICLSAWDCAMQSVKKSEKKTRKLR